MPEPGTRQLKAYGSPKACYHRLSEAVSRDEERLRTYYYDCPPFVSQRPTEDEKRRQKAFDRFAHALQQKPRFEVRLGRLAKWPGADGKDRFTQKKVDVLFAVDLVRLSSCHQIHRAVLFAGDSDFVPAIEAAKDAGTIVELYYHDNPRPHDELLQACDDRILIDQDLIDRSIGALSL